MANKTILLVCLICFLVVQCVLVFLHWDYAVYFRIDYCSVAYSVSPSLSELRKEGESGQRKINKYTRYGTVVLAAFKR